MRSWLTGNQKTPAGRTSGGCGGEANLLETFEQMAEVYQCPCDLWAIKLAPCPTGEAQAAYWVLGTKAACIYDIWQLVIFDCVGLMEEVYRWQFQG